MGLRANLGMCDTGGDSGRGGEGHKAMVGMGSSGRRQTQEWWRAEQGKKANGKRARASGTTPSLPTSFFSLDAGSSLGPCRRNLCAEWEGGRETWDGGAIITQGWGLACTVMGATTFSGRWAADTLPQRD